MKTSPRALRFLATALLAACGGSSSSSDDLAMPDVAAPHDLAVPAPDQSVLPDLVVPPDLVPPRDLSPQVGYCANTPAFGTCVAAFFEPVSACFRPDGACTDGGNGSVCWVGGARFDAIPDQLSGEVGLTWWGGGVTCLQGTEKPRKGQAPLYTFLAGKDTLVYDKQSGSATCPDGTVVQLGNNEAGCSALQAVVEPNLKGCQAGMCP